MVTSQACISWSMSVGNENMIGDWLCVTREAGDKVYTGFCHLLGNHCTCYKKVKGKTLNVDRF
jgi:hypothetical protein